ncbi:hypothetical protein IAU60_003917 [Kwoniella sp. DSM 27419]
MSLPTTSTLPSAFKLVHRVLSASASSTASSSSAQSAGLTTRELVREALALYRSENGLTGTSEQAAAAPDVADKGGKAQKGKGKAVPVRQTKGVNVLPEGHPFVSTTFLKQRILNTLQSQNLIAKSIRPSSPSSSSSSSTNTPSPASAAAGPSKLTFAWKLVDPRANASKAHPWSVPDHWDRLISGEAPGRLAAERKAVMEARKVDLQERAWAEGRDRRTEREIWQWEDRKDGLTTRLERLNLNKRRAEARPKKERRRIERWETLFGGVQEEARLQLGEA